MRNDITIITDSKKLRQHNGATLVCIIEDIDNQQTDNTSTIKNNDYELHHHKHQKRRA